MGATSNTGIGAIIVVLFIFWFVIIVGSLVMMIAALVDIVRRPEWQWKLAGQEKTLWLLLVILVNLMAIPSLIYWFNIRRKLMLVADDAASGRYGPDRSPMRDGSPSLYRLHIPAKHQPVRTQTPAV